MISGIVKTFKRGIHPPEHKAPFLRKWHRSDAPAHPGSDTPPTAHRPDVTGRSCRPVTGFSVDRVVETLKAHGIRRAVISAGGEIYALGRPEGQEGRQIGIQHPRTPNRLAGKVVIADKAISTSGNYESKVEIGDRKLGHLIDTRTGTMPDLMLSSTIIAETTMEAGALATATFLMGAKQAASFITNRKNSGAALIIAGFGKEIETLRAGAFPQIIA